MTDAAKAGVPAGAARPDQAGSGETVGLSVVTKTCAPSRGTSRLSEQAQARIGSDLRSLYDSLVQQPVPDRFRELIERLDVQAPKTP